MASSYLPPGFRFHPTDGELVLYYLKRKISGKPVFKAIAEIDIYKSSPWDLPGKSLLKTKDLEWYFFCPRDRKYASGPRTNRSTENGYWKTTGKDRPVRHSAKIVGMKKTLVFHIGKPPAGERTNWVMHEYRLEEKGSSVPRTAQDAFVLCRIFEKSGSGPKNGEQYGAPIKEEDWDGEESCLVLPQTVSSPGADDAVNEDAVCLPGSHDPTNQIESQELLPSNNIPVESDELQRILLQFDVEGDFVIPSGNCDGQFVEEKDKTNCTIASGNCDGQLVEEKDVNCNQSLVGSTSKVEQVGSNIFDGLEDIAYNGRFDRGDVAGSFFKGFEDDQGDQLFDVFQEGSYLELNDLLIQPPEGIAPNFQRGSSSEFNVTSSCNFTASGSRPVMTPRELFGPTIPELPTLPVKVSDIDLYENKTSDINISGSIGDTYFMSQSPNSALTALEAPLTSASSARRYSYTKSDVPFLSDGLITQAANPFEPPGQEGGLAMQDLSGTLWQDAVEDENTNDPHDEYGGMDDYVGWNS